MHLSDHAQEVDNQKHRTYYYKQQRPPGCHKLEKTYCNNLEAEWNEHQRHYADCSRRDHNLNLPRLLAQGIDQEYYAEHQHEHRPHSLKVGIGENNLGENQEHS